MAKLTYFGHASFQLETQGTHILIDPFLTGNPSAKTGAEDVAADYILVTHGHGDHIGDTVAIAQRTGATAVSNSEIARWLGRQGIETHAMHIGGGYHFPFGYAKLTQALHGSSLPDGSYGGNPGGFLLRLEEGKTLYFAGDTGLFGDMRLIGDAGLDFAAIPIGDNFTMGPEDALRAVAFLRPKVVFPMHYDTFALIEQNVAAWKAQVEAETDAEVMLLNVDGSAEI